MKAVLMSIKPEWCGLIAAGRKTVEVRKNRPKLEVPFKVYIYETKAINHNKIIVDLDGDLPTVFAKGRGKVIGEFVCDGITEFFPKRYPFSKDGTCLTSLQIMDYANGKKVYGWHISDLVIYDVPKELSEFHTLDKEKQKACAHRKRYYTNPDWTNSAELPAGFTCDIGTEMDFCRPYENKSCTCLKPISRPPQSWCYVEEMREDYEEFKKEKIKS